MTAHGHKTVADQKRKAAALQTELAAARDERAVKDRRIAELEAKLAALESEN